MCIRDRYYFFFLIVCYNTVGSTFFHLFRNNICSLTTRDPREKTQVQFIRQMSWTLLSGVVIGMVINMVLLPMWLEKDINGYPVLMLCLSKMCIRDRSRPALPGEVTRPGTPMGDPGPFTCLFFTPLTTAGF